MSKLLIALVVAGFGLGLNAATAQNVDSDKLQAQGQDKVMQDKGQGAKQNSSSSQQGHSSPDKNAQSNNAKTAKVPQDCSTLSGKQKDKCIQATPSGPVNVQTGQESEGKSATAKERDRVNAENQPGANIPAQSNSSVGHPAERSTTGEAQTGMDAQKNHDQTAQSETGEKIPGQSKDTVGNPDGRTTTGEGQSGQEPGQTTSEDSHQKSDIGQVEN